jgi:hypothetical protein
MGVGANKKCGKYPLQTNEEEQKCNVVQEVKEAKSNAKTMLLEGSMFVGCTEPFRDQKRPKGSLV